jgi:hypothetical protein
MIVDCPCCSVTRLRVEYQGRTFDELANDPARAALLRVTACQCGPAWIAASLSLLKIGGDDEWKMTTPGK